jgi:hypothetical protein
MLLHETDQPGEFMTAEAEGARQAHGTQPELGVALRVFDMDVGGSSFSRLKKKNRKPSWRRTVGMSRTYV